MQINKQILIDLGIVIALLAIGTLGYRFSPLLLPKSDLTLHPDPGCDLQRQACGATLPDGGRLELSINPRPIPMVKPLAVDVRILGTQASKVEIDFAGIGMNMGYNRPPLARVDAGHFSGQASLPVCVTGQMAWEATVLIETATQHLAIPYRFDSSPH